jgi:WD40 repeat protein
MAEHAEPALSPRGSASSSASDCSRSCSSASSSESGSFSGSEEEQEPTLTYQRLGGSVPDILKADAASCLAVHAKFLALGTLAGAVHVLDLHGNEIRRFTPHSANVTDVCIDATGEFVGSCSQDGTVVVSSLYSAEASTHWYPRPVRAVALDAEYASKRVFATGGLACQLTINSKGWFGAKDAVVHSGEGPIVAIACAGQMLAWANDLGVKVYDAQHGKRVSYVERAAGSPPAQAFKPHLRWESGSELVIGWADSIKIGRVRLRDAGGGGAGSPAVGVGGPAAGAATSNRYPSAAAHSDVPLSLSHS